MGVDVNEGASRIAQLLQPEQPSDSAPEEPETVEQPETAEVEPEGEATPEPESIEVETEETPEVEPEGDTEPEETKYTVKVNGEEQEVTLEDMRLGYMREADYRRKTSEVARSRDEVKAKEDTLSSKLDDAESLLRLEIDDLNSEENQELKEYDRAAYETKKEALEAKANKLQKLKQDSLESQQARKAERVGKEKELLLSALPEWLDENTLATEAAMVNKVWEDMGFSNQDLDQFIDHRLVVITRKAALYDRLKAAKPESKKIQSKPKSAKAGTTKTSQEKSKANTADARSRLRKSGSMSDAQKAIKSILR
jgi:hypothetical protein